MMALPLIRLKREEPAIHDRGRILFELRPYFKFIQEEPDESAR